VLGFQQLIDECRAGVGHKVFIAGESGAGKTRLVAEAATMARKAGLEVVTADSIGMVSGDDGTIKASPLQPMRPFLREIAEKCRNDPDSADRLLGARGKILVDYEPDLATVPGLERHPAPPPLYGEAARLRLFACIQQTLEAASKLSPLLIVLDDIHWADDLTLELLGLLPDSFFASHSVLLLATYRSEEVGPSLDLAIRSSSSALQVGRLDDDAVSAMASDMLGISSVPAVLSDFLVHQSEGNPFFVAEFLRMAVAAGWLERTEQGQWQLIDSGAQIPSKTLEAPSSVQQVIQRRLETLSADAKAIARLASVLGRTFRSDILMRCAGSMSNSAAMDAINELVSRQVIEPSGTDELRFLHDRIREATYASIGDSERPHLHRTAAESIEGLYFPRPATAATYPALASHWASAGFVEKAIDYWEKAGKTALATAAHRDAVTYFEEALRLTSDVAGAPPAITAERIGTWQRCLGDAYHYLGDVRTSQTHLKASLVNLGSRLPRARALQLLFLAWTLLAARFTGSRRGRSNRERQSIAVRERALATARLAYIYVWQHDSLTAVTTACAAVRLSDRLHPDAPTARPYSQLAFTSGIARLRTLERRFFVDARRIARDHDNMSELGQTYFTEAYLRAGEGRWTEAEALGHEAIRILPIDDRQERENAIAVMGFIARWRGHYEEGVRQAEILRESAQSHRNVEHGIWSIVLASSCLLRLGRIDEAMQALHRAVALLEEKPEWVCDLRASGHLAHGFVLRGDWEQAERRADRALFIMKNSHGPPLLASAFDGVISVSHVYLSAWEHRGSNVPESLMRRTKQALRFSRKVAGLFPIARPSQLVCEARFEALRAKPHRARRTLDAARQLASQLGMPLDPQIRPQEGPLAASWETGVKARHE
jgi:tetratricopeptide (TPR) repeat protein